jgi:hypothetical protein
MTFVQNPAREVRTRTAPVLLKASSFIMWSDVWPHFAAEPFLDFLIPSDIGVFQSRNCVHFR